MGRLEKFTKSVLWLLGTKEELPRPLRAQLEAGLFTSLPIFLGGVLNSIAIACIATWRHPSAPFLIWLGMEIGLGLLRLPVLMRGRAALLENGRPPLVMAAFLSCCWAASVGFGAFISIASEDWILATIICLSAAAMVGGICLRNYGTPRLATLMVCLSLVPCAVAGLFTSQAIVAVISIQLPIYMMTICGSAFALNRMLTSRMKALSDLQQSELLNRSILASSPDYTLILNDRHEVVFCNRPNGGVGLGNSLEGKDWQALLDGTDREAALRALETAGNGSPAHLTIRHADGDGQISWFDVIASPISDESRRVMVVARDITHQKTTEAQAVWMSRHDPLTGLSNRTVLQDEVEARLRAGATRRGSALLIVDIDNFKSINDTLGHDAGDALLCIFAGRLAASVNPGDLVTRMGGDEFALLISMTTIEDIHAVASRIYANLRAPFYHDGRLLECGASIGASILIRDGVTRSEILKAADIALYAAKAGGRGQIKVFEQAMKHEVDRREGMLAAARNALAAGRILPYFQPKIRFLTGEIVGFEALLRWIDEDGQLRSPDELAAAFTDPVLAEALSDRMFERSIEQLALWLSAGLDVGHVAVNATALDLRRAGFADCLLRRLQDRGIPPSFLQLEVTETVFLGRTSDSVEATLRMLSDQGVRIALDDFGTGYASLSHLKHFPVDLLKIDRSFVQELGHRGDAEAITAAVINLGHCLGMEVVAEGVETSAQEAQLLQLGCDTGQGFLYSCALPAEQIPGLLSERAAGSQLRLQA